MKSLTFSHLSNFTAARYLSEALFAIRGFILAHLLGPLTFGLWTEMRLFLTLLQFIRLGTNEAFVRDYPYHVGQGTPEIAEKIKHATTGFNFLTGAAVFITGALLLLARYYSNAIENSSIWFLWLLIFFLNQIYWLVQSQLQAAKLFLKTCKLLAGFSLISTIGGIISALLFGLSGFLCTLIVSYALIIISVLGFSIKQLKPSFDMVLIRQLIRSGFPIMAANALLILLLNIDKVLIWWLLPSKDLGIYSIQSHLTNFILLAPGSMAIVLFPTVMEKLGETKNPESISAYLTQPTLLLAHLACPVLGVMYFALHLPIRWLAPEYMAAIWPGQILILASFFVIVSRMPAAILVSLNKQNLLMMISFLSVAFTSVTSYFAIDFGKGIAGVAGCSAFGFFIYTFLITLLACREINLSTEKITKLFIKVTFPLLVTLLFIGVIDSYIPQNYSDWLFDVIQTTFKCLIFLIPIGCILLICRCKNRILNY